jgi:putative FmdB family regulatory protein
MPVYELKCRECEHDWETRLEWKAPLPACPECGSEEVRKVYHAAALIFKGSGWHCNDYAKNGAKKASNGAVSEPSGEKTETKTESTKTEAPKAEAAKPEAAKAAG